MRLIIKLSKQPACKLYFSLVTIPCMNAASRHYRAILKGWPLQIMLY